MAESRPVRILYVDDDSELADLTRQTMEQAGYKLDLACDIEEGLTKHDSGTKW